MSRRSSHLHFRMASALAPMLALSACASTRALMRRQPEPLIDVSPPRDSTSSNEPEEAPAIVRVVNRTPQTYRVSLTFDGLTRVLGSVSGLEAQDFAIVRKSVAGHGEFKLTASERNGPQRRDSESFPLTGARVVEWVLGVDPSRGVVLR